MGEDTVDDQLHKIEPSSWGAHVSGVADAVASNCDPSSIGRCHDMERSEERREFIGSKSHTPKSSVK